MASRQRGTRPLLFWGSGSRGWQRGVRGCPAAAQSLSLLPSASFFPKFGHFHQHHRTWRWCPLPNFLFLERIVGKPYLNRKKRSTWARARLCSLTHTQAERISSNLDLGDGQNCQEGDSAWAFTSRGKCCGHWVGWSKGVCSLLCLQYLGATAEVPKLLCTNYLKAISGRGGCYPLSTPVWEVPQWAPLCSLQPSRSGWCVEEAVWINVWNPLNFAMYKF